MSQVEFVNAASAQRRQSAPLRGGCCTNPGRCRGRQRCRDRLPMDSQQSAYAAEEALSGPPPLERPTTTERFRGFVQQPPWRLSHKPIRKVVRQSVVGPQCPDRPRTALLLGRSHEDSENSSSSSHRCTSKLFRTVCATASTRSRRPG